MEKRDVVFDVVAERWGRGNFRPFTAGEVAREAKISVNTAKKYLRWIAEQPEPMIYAGEHSLSNGIVAQVFAFSEGWIARWK